MKQALLLPILFLLLWGCSQEPERPVPFKSEDNGVDLIVENGDTLDFLDEKVRIRIMDFTMVIGSDLHLYPVQWLELIGSEHDRGGPRWSDEGMVNLIFVDPKTRTKSKLLDHKAKILSYDFIKAGSSNVQNNKDNTEEGPDPWWHKTKPGNIFYVIQEPLNGGQSSSPVELRRLYQSDEKGDNLQLLSPPEIDVIRWAFTDSAQTRIEMKGCRDTDRDGKYEEKVDQAYIWFIDLESPEQKVEVIDSLLVREIKETFSEQ